MQFMMESIFILVRKAVQIDENSKIEAHRTSRLKGDIKMRNSKRWLAAILAGAMIDVYKRQAVLSQVFLERATVGVIPLTSIWRRSLS